MDTSTTIYAAYLIDRGFGRPADPKRYPHDGIDYVFWLNDRVGEFGDDTGQRLDVTEAAANIDFASWCRENMERQVEQRRERDADVQRQCEEMRALAAANAADLASASDDERDLHRLRTERISEEYADVLDRRRIAEIDEQIAAVEARIAAQARRVAA